jgi:hypothetical protein
VSVRVDIPERGFYAMRLAKNGIEVAVMIWHGAPVVDGERQDRSTRWCVAIDGRSCRYDEEQQCRIPRDVFDAWPYCAKKRITAIEYAFLRRRAKWAREYAPEHPAANPREAIDLRALPPRF